MWCSKSLCIGEKPTFFRAIFILKFLNVRRRKLDRRMFLIFVLPNYPVCPVENQFPKLAKFTHSNSESSSKLLLFSFVILAFHSVTIKAIKGIPQRYPTFTLGLGLTFNGIQKKRALSLLIQEYPRLHLLIMLLLRLLHCAPWCFFKLPNNYLIEKTNSFAKEDSLSLPPANAGR